MIPLILNVFPASEFRGKKGNPPGFEPVKSREFHSLTRHDLTVMEKRYEKGMDSTGFEPVAFTLQT
jgi:hypothetical protein